MPNYKAVDADRLDADLAAVAETIRAKSNTSEPLEFPGGFQNAVDAIQTGGKLQSKTVSPSYSEQTVVADEDYYGLESVTVKAVPRVKACTSSAFAGLPETDIAGTAVKASVDSAAFAGLPETKIAETIVNAGVQSDAGSMVINMFYETTGGTSLTGMVNAKAGDWILATVTTRSATTFPDGWTVLKESTVLNADALNQRMAFLCKRAEAGGTVSITITQADSARIYINLLVFHDIQGFAYHDGTEVCSDTEKINSITVQRPQYDVVVWGCSAHLWNTSVPYGKWQCDGLEAYCIDDNLAQPRQANFIDGDLTVTERAFVPNSTTYYIIDCVEVLKKE